MEITDNVIEVCEYAYAHTDDMASEHFDISLETINRYKRTYNKKPTAKVLLFDIETAPVMAFVWQMWKQNVNKDQIINDWFILTWSAKWLYSPEIINAKLTPKEAKAQDDKRITIPLWHLFEEADILIAHNAINFDVPKMNTRFIMNGLKPPSPYQIIDTLKVARKEFAFSHNRLDYLGTLFGVGNKNKTDFDLWKNCYAGKKDALAEMLSYNDQDVILLEDVYVKLRPWIKSHPNMNLYTEDNVCSNCGSRRIINTGTYRTNVNEYLSEQCECGAWSRKTKKSKMSIAR